MPPNKGEVLGRVGERKTSSVCIVDIRLGVGVRGCREAEGELTTKGFPDGIFWLECVGVVGIVFDNSPLASLICSRIVNNELGERNPGEAASERRLELREGENRIFLVR
jgi:hypothetical protein